MMDYGHATANLFGALTILRELGARPFLTAGTLLGAVREGGFMAHDPDIDIGVFIEELPEPRRLIRAFQTQGFALYREHGTPNLGYELRFVRNAIRTDVFAFYEDDRGRYHAAWKKATPIRRSFPAFGLTLMDFHGVSVFVPDPPEAHLEAKYGPDWRTPVTEWDWAWGPHNAEAWT